VTTGRDARAPADSSHAFSNTTYLPPATASAQKLSQGPSLTTRTHDALNNVYNEVFHSRGRLWARR
jgi:hypothetical protein